MAFEACVPTYTNHIDVKPNSSIAKNIEIVHIKHFLVIGRGNMSSKLIMTNFYSALNKTVISKGGSSEFEFMNTSNEAQKSNYLDVEGKTYDGYLFLSPQDSSYIDFHKQKFVFVMPITPTVAVVGSGNGNAYENTFKTRLFNSEKKLIFSGDIYFHFDPTKERLYDEGVQNFIFEISRLNILLW